MDISNAGRIQGNAQNICKKSIPRMVEKAPGLSTSDL
jgi:hypothetical protein